MESTSEGTRQVEPPREGAGRVAGGYYVEEGTPDPLACASDDECTQGGVLDAGRS